MSRRRLRNYFIWLTVGKTPRRIHTHGKYKHEAYTCMQIHIYVHIYTIYIGWGCPRLVMVKALDCRIVESEFELQSCYYVHFQTNTLGESINPFILLVMCKIVPLLFSENDGFGIKYLQKVDMPLNIETKTKLDFNTDTARRTDE